MFFLFRVFPRASEPCFTMSFVSLNTCIVACTVFNGNSSYSAMLDHALRSPKKKGCWFSLLPCVVALMEDKISGPRDSMFV